MAAQILSPKAAFLFPFFQSPVPYSSHPIVYSPVLCAGFQIQYFSDLLHEVVSQAANAFFFAPHTTWKQSGP